MLPLAEALPLVPQFPMKKVRLYEFVIDVGRKAVLRTDIALVAVEWCPTHLLLCRIVTNNRIRHPLNRRQQIRHPILDKHRRNAHVIGVVEKACHQQGIALVAVEWRPTHLLLCRIVTNNRIRHPLNLRQQIRHPILAKHRRNAHAIGVVEKACHQKGIALVVDECDPMNESYC